MNIIIFILIIVNILQLVIIIVQFVGIRYLQDRIESVYIRLRKQDEDEK